jgi:5-methyltetrahydrofolate--homocysteine methyltransferase
MAREAAGDNHWVIASIGPTGKMLVKEEVTEEELYDTFKAQVIELAIGGANAICIETMIDIEDSSYNYLMDSG